MRSKLIPLVGLAALPAAAAHCPLCTIGAAAAAGGAAYLGMNELGVGLFIGAFAVSMGWWVARLIKKRYVRFQREGFILFSFLATILPMRMMFTAFRPASLFWWGPYGSLFNRTYLLNLFLMGTIIGGIVVYIAPWFSARITAWRGKQLPYQGIVLTFGMLTILAVIAQAVM